ncbi:hypothetical protein ACVWYF_000081 [Hymenobacter sp. UYAg731]
MAVPVSVPIDQRFAQLIQQFGLTKNSFAISLGKTASVVQHLIDGRNKPGYDLLCKVFEIYPNVSRDWLLLGRGPMLVSGEHAPKAVAAAPAPEAAFEPIDLSDVEVHAARRPRPGMAGSRLQPAEIAATLALAAAANQPVRANGDSVPDEAPIPQPAPVPTAPVVAEPPVAPQTAATTEARAAPVASAAPVPTAPSEPLTQVPASATPQLAPVPAPLIPAPVASISAPEVYVAAALHAQHLQHQLALSEMRNQHLLEQQTMLREMLAMARQSMV